MALMHAMYALSIASAISLIISAKCECGAGINFSLGDAPISREYPLMRLKHGEAYKMLFPETPSNVAAKTHITIYNHQGPAPPAISVNNNLKVQRLPEITPPESQFETNISILESTDVFAFSFGARVAGNNLEGYLSRCFYRYKGDQINFTGSLVNRFNTVVAFANGCEQMYGHLIVDYLVFLELLPPLLLSSATFVLEDYDGFLVHHLSLYGIPANHIVYIGRDHVFFARQYLFIDPFPCLYIGCDLIQKVRSRFERSLNLSKESPRRTVIYNRSYTRSIENLLEILELFQNVCLDECVEISGEFDDPSEAAAYFNSVLMMFCVHGSTMGYMVFMQPGSIFCEYQYEFEYTSPQQMSRVLQVGYILTYDRSLSFSALTFILDTEKCRTCFREGLYFLKTTKHRTWGKSSNKAITN